MDGDILKVLTNGVLLSLFTMEPVYQAATTTEYRHFETGPGIPVLVAKQVQVDEKKVAPSVAVYTPVVIRKSSYADLPLKSRRWMQRECALVRYSIGILEAAFREPVE